MYQGNMDILRDVIENGPFEIRFPLNIDLDQDEEWGEFKHENKWQRIRFHDYYKLYDIPGLYETLFYRTLRCNSPSRVVSLLKETLDEHRFPAEDLCVLDLGAGNGMVGEVLQNIGTRRIVGADIIAEAKAAAERDRPWVYNEYHVADFTQLPIDMTNALRQWEFNSLTAVAALGFGDIPFNAFKTAFNLVQDGGWIAFNIKEDFLRSDSGSEFSDLLNNLTRQNIIQMEAYRRYCHRLSIAGQPLYYIAAVAQKLKGIPESI